MSNIRTIHPPSEKQIPASEVLPFLASIQSQGEGNPLWSVQIQRIDATAKDRGSVSAIDAQWLHWCFLENRPALPEDQLELIVGRVVNEFATRGLEYFVRIAPQERDTERLLTLFTILSQDMVGMLAAWEVPLETNEEKIAIMLKLVAELGQGGFNVPGAPSVKVPQTKE